MPACSIIGRAVAGRAKAALLAAGVAQKPDAVSALVLPVACYVVEAQPVAGLH